MTTTTSADGKIGIKDRIHFLALLPQAGWGCLSLLLGLQLLECVMPSALSVTMAWITTGISGSTQAALLTRTALPLAAFALVLVLSHAAETFIIPAQYIVKMRIDGKRRAQVAQLFADYPTLEVLEDEGVQELIRIAKAEPRNWTERTPGDGALAQLTMCMGLVGTATSCAVLAHFELWIVPCLLITSGLMRVVLARNGTLFLREWRRGIGEGRKAEVWSNMLTVPAVGKEVRIFGFIGIAAARARRHTLAMFQPTWQVAVRNMRVQWMRFVLVISGLGLCYGLVADETARGRNSVAVETAVLLAAWSIYLALNGYDARAVLGALSGERAFTQLRSRLRPAGTTPKVVPMYDGRREHGVATMERTRPPLVRFESIGFRYPNGSAPVFDDLNLQIMPGELLAIVGLNGAGKSTLIKLLAGLYRPDSGSIFADELDVWAEGIENWRSRIAVVFQEFARLHLSLEENITLGRASNAAARDNRSERPLDRAIAKSGLSRLIEQLPDGVATQVSRSRTKGVDLSGGQWQQVVLARALYATAIGAQVIVLDEPTAHLDVRSEHEVFGRLTEERGDTTVVLISHRLSTVRYADRIVLLENGRIVESGSHDELMHYDGGYARMFRSQAERFAGAERQPVEEPA